MTTTKKKHRWTRKAIQAEVDKLDDEIQIYWDRNDELSKGDITRILENGLEGLDEVAEELTGMSRDYFWEREKEAIDAALDAMEDISPVSEKTKAAFLEMVIDSNKLLHNTDIKGLARNTGGAYFVVIVNEPEILFQAWRGVQSKGQVDELCELCTLLNVNPAPLQELVTCDNDNRPSYDPEPAVFPDHPERDGQEYVSLASLKSVLNETMYGGQLVFMLKMDVRDLIDNPDAYRSGPLTVKAGTLGVMYEYCNGAGSCDDMELLKDLTLPAGSFSFELDASRKWGLQSCYGFTDAPWKQGSVEIPEDERIVPCALCEKRIWLTDSWSPGGEATCAECDTEVTGRPHPPSLNPDNDPEPTTNIEGPLH